MESRFVSEKVALDEQILRGKNAKLAKMENGLHGQLVKLQVLVIEKNSVQEGFVPKKKRNYGGQDVAKMILVAESTFPEGLNPRTSMFKDGTIKE